MEFQNPNQDLGNPNNGDHPITTSFEDIDSTCSTPYASAPSSPGRVAINNSYFFSAPASPMHYILSSTSSDFVSASSDTTTTSASSQSFEFEFAARFSSNNLCANGVSMSSADELFFNGQIRPMKLSSHLQRPQMLAPLIDLDEEDEERNELAQDSMIRGRDLRLRNRSLHRRARSLSPLRLTSASAFQWNEDEKDENIRSDGFGANAIETEVERMKTVSSTETTPSVSASSSRSSSSGSRHSKRWVFLKDFLRSKSEGRGNSKDKFWSSISFNPSAKDKKKPITFFNPSLSFHESQKQKQSPKLATNKTSSVRPANGVSKRRVPQSPHELHYTTNRAQAEEMKKRTSLPYRQGLFGCLGFSSKSYGAMNGFAKALNPVSSRFDEFIHGREMRFVS